MPRWRTMIDPDVTSWPSPALTPSRWPALSRPFLTLEPAFLCAIATRPSSCASAWAPHRWWRHRRPARPPSWTAWRRSSRPRPSGPPSASSALPSRPPWPEPPWPAPRPRASALADALPAAAFGSAVSALAVAVLAVAAFAGFAAGSADSAPTASFAASAASSAACRAAASSRRLRSVGLASLGLALGLGRALAAEPDVGDAQDGELLAVALLDPAAGLRAVLERDDLVAAVAPDDLGLDGGAVDDGRPDGGLGPVGDEEHALQRDRLAGLDVEQLDLELGADLDAVLLPAGLDDCVHGSSEERRGRGRPLSGHGKTPATPAGANGECRADRSRTSTNGDALGLRVASCRGAIVQPVARRSLSLVDTYVSSANVSA